MKSSCGHCHYSWSLAPENILMAILPLLQIQEEMSVGGEVICTKFW